MPEKWDAVVECLNRSKLAFHQGLTSDSIVLAADAQEKLNALHQFLAAKQVAENEAAKVAEP